MVDPPDFPLDPTVGQKYTSPAGVTYVFDGAAWTVGFYDSTTQEYMSVGDILDQIRTLLQDTDNSGGEYRYSDDSIILNINMGLLEMFRLRPDIFLENSFIIPTYNAGHLEADWALEPQTVPAIIYYAVGMTQVRDDEGTQDTRASAFLAKFSSMLISLT